MWKLGKQISLTKQNVKANQTNGFCLEESNELQFFTLDTQGLGETIMLRLRYT